MRPSLPNSARLLPITLSITLSIVAVLAVASGAAFAVHLASQSGVSTQAHPGTPAIDVTLPGQVPAFTAADVRAYYTLSHGYPDGRAPDGSTPPIQSITFMTAQQAMDGVMHHGSLDLPTSALVCVVVVGGPIIHVGLGGPGRLTVPGTPHPTPAPPRPAPTAYMIFDASTGNLLADGF